MDKIYILGDQDTVSAFRLAGVEGVPAFHRRLDTYALAVEYVEGETLKDLSRQEIETAVFDRLAELFDRLHARGVVHLDSHQKTNILLTPAGQVKVADFGIAHTDIRRPVAIDGVDEPSISTVALFSPRWAAGATCARLTSRAARRRESPTFPKTPHEHGSRCQTGQRPGAWRLHTALLFQQAPGAQRPGADGADRPWPRDTARKIPLRSARNSDGVSDRLSAPALGGDDRRDQCPYRPHHLHVAAAQCRSAEVSLDRSRVRARDHCVDKRYPQKPSGRSNDCQRWSRLGRCGTG